MASSSKVADPVAWIDIDLKQFKENLRLIRRFLKPSVQFCLPVKANAYGHGLIQIAKAAASQVDYFAVALVKEGIALRQAGLTTPILVLGGIDECQVDSAIAHNLQLTVASSLKGEYIARAAKRQGKHCDIHIKVDTGMSRVGVRPESVSRLYQQLSGMPELVVKGLYSHLATADVPHNTFAESQIAVFDQLQQEFKQRYPQGIAHIAHSGGLCFYPQSHFDMVRPGLLSLGYFPSAFPYHESLEAIRPFYTVKARASYFKVVPGQCGIGYGHTYITQQQTRIVTVPVGYGDGFPRALSNVGQVLIRGQRYDIAGSVCMDCFMVDLGAKGTAYVGDEVILIGRQGNEEITLQAVAEQCDTIAYDILCGFNDRIVRHYFE